METQSRTYPNLIVTLSNLAKESHPESGITRRALAYNDKLFSSVTLAKPGDSFGAARIKTSEQEWKTEARKEFERALPLTKHRTEFRRTLFGSAICVASSIEAARA